MKGGRTREREGIRGDDVMTETVVHDSEWGDSAEGPVHGDGDVLPSSPTGVTSRRLPRDATRDPWGGASVQDVREIPSGYGVTPAPAESRMPNLDDEQGGGNAGIVGQDDRLVDRGK